jgi:predicted alpha/beta-fold hydrolase
VLGKLVLSLVQFLWSPVQFLWSLMQFLWSLLPLARGVDPQHYVPEVHVSQADTGAEIRAVLGAMHTRLLHKPYVPSPLMQLGAAQLLLAELHVPGAKTVFERELVQLADGGTVAVDWAAEAAALPDDAPAVLVLHGIAGGSRDWNSLCRRLAHEGVRCGVYIRRGHGGLVLTTPQLTAVGDHADLDELLAELRRRHPRAPLFAAGFSAGGAILTNHLARTGDTSLLAGAVVVSPGFNMPVAMARIPSVYQRLITLNLSRVVLRNRAVLREANIGLRDALGSNTIADYNRRVYTPLYRHTRRAIANPCDQLVSEDFDPGMCTDRLARPLLFVSARDDPVCLAELIPYDDIRASTSAAIIVTEHGSHCWFLRDWSSEPFINDVIVEFVRGCLEHTAAKPGSDSSRAGPAGSGSVRRAAAPSKSSKSRGSGGSTRSRAAKTAKVGSDSSRAGSAGVRRRSRSSSRRR